MVRGTKSIGNSTSLACDSPGTSSRKTSMNSMTTEIFANYCTDWSGVATTVTRKTTKPLYLSISKPIDRISDILLDLCSCGPTNPVACCFTPYCQTVRCSWPEGASHRHACTEVPSWWPLLESHWRMSPQLLTKWCAIPIQTRQLSSSLMRSYPGQISSAWAS